MAFGFGSSTDLAVQERLHEFQELGIDPRDPRRETPQGDFRLPKFVKFHLLDPGSDCDEIFWEDPVTFTPRRGRNGYIDSWGIYPHDKRGIRDVDGLRVMRRTMHTQTYYSHDFPIPEVQFVNALIKKKVAQLEKLDLSDLRRRDFTLYISVPHIETPYDSRLDRYWRRIRVSGGLPLGVFADKIIIPLWGWVRNLHAHAYHDFKDGALFGPKESNAIDLQSHLDKSGYAYIPEEGYTIAHILQKEGHVMGFHYDFGDNWWVDIKLEEVASAVESTGAVVIIDGSGGVFPDGEQTGLFNWEDYLKKAEKSPRGKREAVKVLFQATNFSGKAPPKNPLDYDFDAFDLNDTRKTVYDALDSKGSLSYATKKFVTPLAGMDAVNSDEGMLSRIGRTAKDMKKGTAISQTQLHGGGFLEEGLNMTRKDNPRNTACANCGSPHDLKACAQCSQRYYCGKDCQRVCLNDGVDMLIPTLTVLNAETLERKAQIRMHEECTEMARQIFIG